jgi:hypothetical protein
MAGAEAVVRAAGREGSAGTCTVSLRTRAIVAGVMISTCPGSPCCHKNTASAQRVQAAGLRQETRSQGEATKTGDGQEPIVPTSALSGLSFVCGASGVVTKGSVAAPGAPAPSSYTDALPSPEARSAGPAISAAKLRASRSCCCVLANHAILSAGW